MSETDSYFALWIHSHPGSGTSATYPSQTDLEQEQEWLRDYSKDLVNAIMVKDGFVRFWGQALKNKQITVQIEGAGVKRVSDNEHIYKLEY
jgi:proteasome lid subunit RPN8/RPN11